MTATTSAAQFLLAAELAAQLTARGVTVVSIALQGAPGAEAVPVVTIKGGPTRKVWRVGR